MSCFFNNIYCTNVAVRYCEYRERSREYVVVGLSMDHAIGISIEINVRRIIVIVERNKRDVTK